MGNTTLIRVLGLLFIAYVIAAVLILIFYKGDAVVAIAALSGIVPLFVSSLLSFRQSVLNGEAQKATATKVEAVSTKVEEAATVAGTTHELVNSRMDEFKRTVEELALRQAELAASMAREQGIKEGRDMAQQDATVVAAAAAAIIAEKRAADREYGATTTEHAVPIPPAASSVTEPEE